MGRGCQQGDRRSPSVGWIPTELQTRVSYVVFFFLALLFLSFLLQLAQNITVILMHERGGGALSEPAANTVFLVQCGNQCAKYRGFPNVFQLETHMRSLVSPRDCHHLVKYTRTILYLMFYLIVKTNRFPSLIRKMSIRIVRHSVLPAGDPGKTGWQLIFRPKWQHIVNKINK